MATHSPGTLLDFRGYIEKTHLFFNFCEVHEEASCSNSFPLCSNLFTLEVDKMMAQTPLHVSAGHNWAEIIKFLLDWQGKDRVELEARNMYGETPLHMAAKNVCNEAAHLLLAFGAFIEAKANNGMTRLQLAVWHSLRAEECSSMKTLLVCNADCSAKDNEEMTPLNHLSNGPGNEKLQKLLNQHLEEQRKDESLKHAVKPKPKWISLKNELANIVGLNDLKVQLRKWAKGMLLDERRRALGLQVGTRRPPHMAFLGNPGSGKTMAARILGNLLIWWELYLQIK